jgi:hypothetical protein
LQLTRALDFQEQVETVVAQRLRGGDADGLLAVARIQRDGGVGQIRQLVLRFGIGLAEREALRSNGLAGAGPNLSISLKGFVAERLHREIADADDRMGICSRERQGDAAKHEAQIHGKVFHHNTPAA